MLPYICGGEIVQSLQSEIKVFVINDKFVVKPQINHSNTQLDKTVKLIIIRNIGVTTEIIKLQSYQIITRINYVTIS